MNRQFGEFAWRKVTILSAFSKESFKKKVDEKMLQKTISKMLTCDDYEIWDAFSTTL